MEPAGGVALDAAETRRTHWRGALIGVGVAIAAGLLTVLAPQPAHADDGDRAGLIGSLVQGLASGVTEVVDPVVAPLPDARELPVVGGLVGEVVDSRPVSTVTAPVSGLVDGLLGDTVGSLPILGGVLGDTPLGSVTQPVSGVVDGTLGQVAGTTGDADAAPPAPGVDSGSTASGAATALGSALVGLAGDLPLISHAGELAVVGAVGAEGLFHGPVSAPGDLTPTSAVTAGGPPIGLAAAVLGAGLLFFLARGRLGPAGVRAHPSPVFATDTSPD
ncbi:MAG TPA: hypothetical protein VL043_09255 [Protaetiibacter sp.]|nr:hypothetical protein [Protaetiibacter sp.]